MKDSFKGNSCILFFVSLLLLSIFHSKVFAGDWTPIFKGDAITYYVAADAPFGGDGLSWATAFNDIQMAIEAAKSKPNGEGSYSYPGNIWVKGGVYKPTYQIDPSDERTKTFYIYQGVKLYGGFKGDEKELAQRRMLGYMWEFGDNSTILDGNLNESEQVYRVVTFASRTDNSNLLSVLECFVVRGGLANGDPAKGFDCGAGVLMTSYCRVNASLFYNNKAIGEGAAVYVKEGNNIVRNVQFSNNISDNGAVITVNQNTQLPNDFHGLIINHNTADGIAPGDNDVIINLSVIRNSGLGIRFPFSGFLHVYNTLIWGNGLLQPAIPVGTTVDYCASEVAFGTNSVELGNDDSLIGFVDGNVVNNNPGKIVSGDCSDAFRFPVRFELDENSVCLKVGNDKYLNPGMTHAINNIGRVINIVDIGATENSFYKLDKNGRAYVTFDGAGTMDGSSWLNAAKGSNLQSIFDVSGVHEVWIAGKEGGAKYYPRFNNMSIDLRTARFEIPADIKIYGGFKGDETSVEQRPLFDKNNNDIIESWELLYETILCGDLNQNDVINDNIGYNSLIPSVNKTLEDNVFTVVNFSKGNDFSLLNGFSITGGSADGSKINALYGKGGGVCIESKSSIINCQIYFCFAENMGGGVFINNSEAIVDACRIFNNAAGNDFNACYGGGVYLNNGIIVNSVINNNNNDGVYVNAGRVINSTIVRNSSSGIHFSGTGTNTTVSNSIIWGNYVQMVDFSNVTFINCAVEGGVSGSISSSNNLNLSQYNLGNETGHLYPYFITPTVVIGNFYVGNGADASNHPASWQVITGSACIDAGNDLMNTISTKDLAGAPRLNGKSVDIGAFEFQKNEMNNKLFVVEGGSGVRDGSSWMNAMSSLQDAIDYLAKEYIKTGIDGEVWVAKGIYYPTGRIADETGDPVTNRHKSFIMRSGVNVYGGFAGTESNKSERAKERLGESMWKFVNITTLSGNLDKNNDEWRWDELDERWIPVNYDYNSYHVVWFASEGFDTPPYMLNPPVKEAARANALKTNVIMDGFTITGGYADQLGQQGKSTRFGGGVYLVQNGTIQNCVITKNYAVTRGGGVFVNGGKVIMCVVSENASPGEGTRNGQGGGVYLFGVGWLSQSIVINNSAREGGGVFIKKDIYNTPVNMPYMAIAETSIVANNTAEDEAGGIYCDLSGVITAMTVVNNKTVNPQMEQIGKTGGIYFKEYCILTNTVVWGNVAASDIYQLYLDGGSIATEMMPNSMQLYNSAIQGWDRIITGANVSVKNMLNLSDNNVAGFAPGFINPSKLKGVNPNEDNIWNYKLSVNSYLLRKGANMLEAPFMVLSPAIRVHIPIYDIDNNTMNFQQPEIGSSVSNDIIINHSVVESEGKSINVVFVDPNGILYYDGSSWDSPTININLAIKYLASIGGGEVWVKEGMMKLIDGYSSMDARTVSIMMNGGVDVYGGFPASMRNPNKNDRNPVLFRSVIDGNIGDPNSFDDNAYHCVSFLQGNVESQSIIDGFHIINGNASTGSPRYNVGGGIFVETDYAIIRNCFVENNMAVNGAGIFSRANDIMIINTVINNNETTDKTSQAAVNIEKGGVLMNCSILNNKSCGVKVNNVNSFIYNTVVWGNNGYYQIYGSPADMQFCAIQDATEDLSKHNISLSRDSLSANYPTFTNPTTVVGIVLKGYQTIYGGPAVFEPTCESVLVNAGTLNEGISGFSIPKTDITASNLRTLGGLNDIGAFMATCLLPNGEVIYVKENGSGDGSSWLSPLNSVQRALNSAVKGQQIWVAAGTYTETLTMKDGVNVYGGFPATGNPGMEERNPTSQDSNYKTVLQAKSTRGAAYGMRVLTQPINNNAPSSDIYFGFLYETYWDGFTIQNGGIMVNDGEDGGAGVILRTNGILVNCIIKDNINSFSGNTYIQLRGGGVHCRNGKLINCYIHNNETNVTVRNRNMGEGYGAGIYMVKGTVYNCVITKNSATITGSGSHYALGVGAFVEYADFYNNTIAYNSASTSDGSNNRTAVAIGRFDAAGLRLFNCIIWQNNVATQIQPQASGGLKWVSYSCIQQNLGSATGPGVINKDPMFVNPDNNNFRLKEGSPCWNTGNNNPEGGALPSTDMDYHVRIQDCTIDMGAYEITNEFPIKADYSRGDTAVIYVTEDGSGNADGSSWSSAACALKLQTAINAAAKIDANLYPVRQVWVAQGIYKPTEQTETSQIRSLTFIIPAGVEVIGGFRGPDGSYNGETKLEEKEGMDHYASILSGDLGARVEENCYHVVTFGNGKDSFSEDKFSILDGFVIENGNANHSNIPLHQRGGGVLLVGGGVIRNCFIRNNYAIEDGGGLFMYPESIISGSVITCNGAANGGGVFAGNRSYIAGCTVVGNKASKTGGGISFIENAIVHSSAFWHNYAETGQNYFGDSNHSFMDDISGFGKICFNMNYCAVEGVKPGGINNYALTTENEILSMNFRNDGIGVGDFIAPAFKHPDNIGKENDLYQNGVLYYSDYNNSALSLLPVSGLRAIGAEKELFTSEVISNLHLNLWDINGNIRLTDDAFDYIDVGAYAYTDPIVPKPVVIDNKFRLYVSLNAKGKVDGSSWDNAMGNIQDALTYFRNNNLGKQCEIWISKGIYYPSLRQKPDDNYDVRLYSFELNPFTSIFGGFAGMESSLDERSRFDKNKNRILEEYEFENEVVLSGNINYSGYHQNSYHVLYYPDPDLTDFIQLDGLIVSGGEADKHKNAHVDNEDFEGGVGGGLYSVSPVMIKNCSFVNNWAAEAGGAIFGNNVQIFNCSFAANSSADIAGVVYISDSGSLTAVNSVFYNNEASSGSAIYSLGEVSLLNNTISRNKSTYISGVTVFAGSGYMTNCVIWGNQDAASFKGDNFVVSYTAYQNREEIDRITMNLAIGSNNDSPSGPRFGFPTDIAGIDGYYWGADWSLPSLSVLVDRGDDVSYRNLQSVHGKINVPDQINYKREFEGSNVWNHLDRIVPSFIDMGAYEYGTPALTSRDTIYVKVRENPNVLCDGSDWEHATSDLQRAISALTSSFDFGLTGHKCILVATGEYIAVRKDEQNNTCSFYIDKIGYEVKSLSIIGGFPERAGSTVVMSDRNITMFPSILCGNDAVGSYHVVNIFPSMDVPVLIDGFTIQGGNANGSNAEHRTGAGIYAANGGNTIIQNVILTRNFANIGGHEGGALYIAGGAVQNVLSHHNDAIGMDVSSSTLLRNNTIVNNKLGGLKGSAEIVNTVLWGNEGFQLKDNNLNVSYSAIESVDVYPGIGNHKLSKDNSDTNFGPKFIDPENGNYRLLAGYILPNNGSSDALISAPEFPEFDLANLKRVNGSSVDIGAYEYPEGLFPIIYVTTEGIAGNDGSSWDEPTTLGEAILRAGISTVKGEVWVKGGEYNLDEDLLLSEGVNIYGGFLGREIAEPTPKEAREKLRPGILENGTDNMSIVSVGDYTIKPLNEQHFNLKTEINGFGITKKSDIGTVAVMLKKNVFLTYSVLYGNTGLTNCLIDNDGGILFNSLLRDNDCIGAPLISNKGNIINVTAVTSKGTVVENIDEGKVVNSIIWNGSGIGNVGEGFINCNIEDPQFAFDYVSDVNLKYQLKETSDCIDGGLEENGVFDFSIERDLLGNMRIFDYKNHYLAKPDIGCFETWNVEDGFSVDVKKDFYPVNHSVLYVGKRSIINLTDSYSKTFAPEFLLLRSKASLKSGKCAVSIRAIAVERDLRQGMFDMISLPFDLDLNEGTGCSATLNGLDIQLGSGIANDRVNFYSYNGQARAEQNKYVAKNSPFWKKLNVPVLSSTHGYLVELSDSETLPLNVLRLMSVSNSLPVYTEIPGEIKQVLLQQYNKNSISPDFTDPENMGWNLFGAPYLYNFETNLIDSPKILYWFDGNTYKVIESWNSLGSDIPPFTAVFAQTATLSSVEKLNYPKHNLVQSVVFPSDLIGLYFGDGINYDNINFELTGNQFNYSTFNIGNDGLKIMSPNDKVPQIYILNSNGTRLALNRSFSEDQTIALGVYISNSGKFEIGITKDYNYGDYTDIFLIDKLYNKHISLVEAPYSFYVASSGELNDRFELCFKNKIDSSDDSSVVIYAYNKTLFVKNINYGTEIDVIDLNGRVLVKTVSDDFCKQIPLKEGVYMVRIITAGGNVKVKKVVIPF